MEQAFGHDRGARGAAFRDLRPRDYFRETAGEAQGDGGGVPRQDEAGFGAAVLEVDGGELPDGVDDGGGGDDLFEEAGAVPLGADVREVGAEPDAGVAEAMAGDAHRGEHGAAAGGVAGAREEGGAVEGGAEDATALVIGQEPLEQIAAQRIGECGALRDRGGAHGRRERAVDEREGDAEGAAAGGEERGQHGGVAGAEGAEGGAFPFALRSGGGRDGAEGGIQSGDPVAHEQEAAFVDEAAAEVGHVSAAFGREPIEQHAPLGIAGRDHAGIGQAEVALHGFLVEEFRGGERALEIEEKIGGAAAVEAVAGAAVGVEVGAGAQLGGSEVAVRLGEGRTGRGEQGGKQGRELAVGCGGSGAGELEGVEAGREVELRIVATQAFGTAVKPPRLAQRAAGSRGIFDVEHGGVAAGGEQVGVGLGGVPAVTVGGPLLLIVVEDLGFDAAAGGGVAAFELERVGLREHGVVGQDPAADGQKGDLGRGDGRAGGAGKTRPALTGGVVGPARNVDRVGHDAGRGDLAGGVGKQTGFAEPVGKVRRCGGRGMGGETPESAAGIVTDEKFAVGLDAEAHGCEGGAAQLAVPGHAVALGAQRPEHAGLPIAVDVGSAQGGEFRAVVELAAGDARGLRVRVGDERREHGRGADEPVGPHVLAAGLGETPAVVSAALDALDHLPELPADVARVEVAGLGVEGDAPRIAQPVGPEFAARPGHADERVVPGNGIRESGVGAVDVDAGNAREQVGNVLARDERIGRFGRAGVACAEIEHAVGAEAEVAAVVAALQPRDDHVAGGEIEARDGIGGDFEADDARAVFAVRLAAGFGDRQHVGEAVFGKLGVKREGERFGQLRVELGEVTEQIGGGDGLVGAKRAQFSFAFDDDEPVGAGQRGDLERLGERERGKRALEAERGGRLGRACDRGGGPRRARRGRQVRCRGPAGGEQREGQDTRKG